MKVNREGDESGEIIIGGEGAGLFIYHFASYRRRLEETLSQPDIVKDETG